jgi:hypothetical protein
VRVCKAEPDAGSVDSLGFMDGISGVGLASWCADATEEREREREGERERVGRGESGPSLASTCDHQRGSFRKAPTLPRSMSATCVEGACLSHEARGPLGMRGRFWSESKTLSALDVGIGAEWSGVDGRESEVGEKLGFHAVPRYAGLAYVGGDSPAMPGGDDREGDRQTDRQRERERGSGHPASLSPYVRPNSRLRERERERELELEQRRSSRERQRILKSPLNGDLYGNCTRTITFENFCQVAHRA